VIRKLEGGCGIGGWIARSVRWLFLGVIVLITICPLVWVFLSAFKTNQEIIRTPLALPSNWSLNGFKAALDLAPIPTFYLNSIIVSIFSTVLNVLLVSMGAYVLARVQSRWSNALMAVLSVSLFIPITAMIQSIYNVINSIGLYDTRTGLILVYTAMGLPMTLFIMRSHFLSVPKEVEESAYIDGSSFGRTFFTVALPIAKPGLSTAGILCFIACWNEFLFSLTLTSKTSIRTLPLALNYFTSAFSFNYTALFAAVVMIVLPSILVFIALQEQVVGGLASGAVKG